MNKAKLLVGENSGHLNIGFDIKKDRALGTVDYLHHITNTSLGEFSAFATGYGGARKTIDGWVYDYGATGGLELSW